MEWFCIILHQRVCMHPQRSNMKKNPKNIKMCEIKENTITENPPDEHTQDLVQY